MNKEEEQRCPWARTWRILGLSHDVWNQIRDSRCIAAREQVHVDWLEGGREIGVIGVEGVGSR